MATVYVTIGDVKQSARKGPDNVLAGNNLRSETITSSGTSAQGSLAATGNQVAKVFCDTAVYATTDATATAANGTYVAAGIAEYIALTKDQQIAVIDV